MDQQEINLQSFLNAFRDNKFITLLNIFERQIKKNFRNAGYASRPTNSIGLWCFTLLPAIIILYTCQGNVSRVYRLVAYLSVGCLFYSVLFILFLYMSCLTLRESQTAGCMAAILLSTVPIYLYLEEGLIFSLTFSTITVLPYSYLLRAALYRSPKTFTVGEAMIISEGVSLFIVACALTIYDQVYMKKYIPIQEMDEETKLIETYIITVLSTVGLLVTVLMHLKEHHRTLKNLGIITGFAAVIALTEVYVVLGPSCLSDFLHYVFRDAKRKKLLSFWLSLVCLATAVVFYRAELQVKVTSTTRKSFHILASLVFLSGILSDIKLLVLASGMIFGVIIFIEALRLSGIEPIATTLQAAFDVYSDEKDVGLFAMTPIYLYIGLACPLILVPWRTGTEMELLSGVLSIGVGDAAASWLGERYGANKWPGSNRTLEGTVGNITSQIIFVHFLHIISLAKYSPRSLFRAAVSAVATGLAEVHLEQVDNLILPLVSILAFQITAPFR